MGLSSSLISSDLVSLLMSLSGQKISLMVQFSYWLKLFLRKLRLRWSGAFKVLKVFHCGEVKV